MGLLYARKSIMWILCFYFFTFSLPVELIGQGINPPAYGKLIDSLVTIDQHLAAIVDRSF